MSALRPSILITTTLDDGNHSCSIPQTFSSSSSASIGERDANTKRKPENRITGGNMAPSKSTSSHLALLADTTLTSLYERERLIRLGSHPSTADDAEMRRSLNTLKLGIGQLEKELEDLEGGGA